MKTKSKFYCYRGNAELGKEPLGTDGKFIHHGQRIGAVRKANCFYASYRLYRFSNFYDDSTFRLVASK